MKKYLPVLFLVVFLVPSIAMASWWNPFTWKIFKKREPAPQVQVINTEKEKTPEEKISELQKQLDELKNENKSVEPIKENKSDKKVEVKKTTNSTKNTEQNKLLEQTRIEAELKAKFAEQDALINKQRADEKAKLEELDKQSKLNELELAKQREQAKLDALNNIKLQELREKTEGKLNSPECLSATNRLSSKNTELKNTESRLAQISTMTQEKGDLLIKSALLNSEILKITYEKYEACQGYIPGEIPKTYNTSCYYIGYTLHCNTQ